MSATAYSSGMGSPFSGGIRPPAPRRQCWTMVRLCRTSSLKNHKMNSYTHYIYIHITEPHKTNRNWLNPVQQASDFSRHHNIILDLFLLTCSCPALPVQTSEGAEVQAGGSGPVNKKQRRSPQHWAHATGYPNSTGPQADPSPTWNEHNEQSSSFRHLCRHFQHLKI